MTYNNHLVLLNKLHKVINNMTFEIIKSKKEGLDSKEGYIIVRSTTVFLRLLGEKPHYELMTATADEDNGPITVCQNQKQLITSALQLALELKLKPLVTSDHNSRKYVKICSLIIEDNNQEIQTKEILKRFFEIYDNYDIKSRAEEEMIELYNDLAIDDSGEDVYLSDGMYLSSDGSLH
ncbi:hypothetical protein CIN_17450 [Commensalibacter intestini A911]|uniref:Uncharacterized protein n=2 Tax=Commensalibacter intestini TaxID=479936 RepID=G6F299_9PROT|nr:hypothetical protein CIN_17450 [Commensalibacter intestini A911]